LAAHPLYRRRLNQQSPYDVRRVDPQLECHPWLHDDGTLNAASTRRQIQHDARSFQLRSIQKRRGKSYPKAGSRPAIRRFHICNGLAGQFPINEALTEGKPLDIRFPLGQIQDLGGEFA
jgi:hypothetical protein